MKKLFLLLTAALMMGTMTVRADETVTVSATNSDISQGLDLRVVAKLFAEAKNLEQFETMLNNPDSAFNNLDLNGDGIVDYLRVVETGEGNSRLIVLQAILAKDIYQDVASIVVKKDEQTSQVSVEIVGDEYIYGTKYVIVPTYYYRPYLYDWFWGPHYVYWHSPYYWDFYPRWWYSWHPYAYDWYWHRCHHYCSYRPICSYRHTHEVSRYAHDAMYARTAERQMGASQFAAQRATRAQSPTAAATRPALERSQNAVVAARSVQPAAASRTATTATAAAQRGGTATMAAAQHAGSAATAARATQPLATNAKMSEAARKPLVQENKMSTRTFGSSNIASAQKHGSAAMTAATRSSVSANSRGTSTSVSGSTRMASSKAAATATTTTTTAKSRTNSSFTAPARDNYTTGTTTTRNSYNSGASRASYSGSTSTRSSYNAGSSHSNYSGGSRSSFSSGSGFSGGGSFSGGGGFSGGSGGGRSSVSAGSRR